MKWYKVLLGVILLPVTLAYYFGARAYLKVRGHAKAKDPGPGASIPPRDAAPP